jgi:propionyl-CoA carboxylase alpha chain
MTETNFVNGNISTKYLPQTYPQGFNGKQLSAKESQNLAALAAAVFVRDNIRAEHFLNIELTDDSLKSKDYCKEWNLVIDIGKGEISLPLTLKVENDVYVIDINGNQIKLPFNFSMASSVLEFNIDNEIQTLQLISFDGTGRMKLQYKGTIVCLLN